MFHVDAAESKMLRATGSGAPDKTRREVNSKLSLALSLRAVEFRICASINGAIGDIGMA